MLNSIYNSLRALTVSLVRWICRTLVDRVVLLLSTGNYIIWLALLTGACRIEPIWIFHTNDCECSYRYNAAILTWWSIRIRASVVRDTVSAVRPIRRMVAHGKVELLHWSSDLPLYIALAPC